MSLDLLSNPSKIEFEIPLVIKARSAKLFPTYLDGVNRRKVQFLWKLRNAFAKVREKEIVQDRTNDSRLFTTLNPVVVELSSCDAALGDPKKSHVLIGSLDNKRLLIGPH